MEIKLDNKTLDIIKENEGKCIDCKACYRPCPMMKEYSSSPKKLMQDIIKEGKVNKNIPYSCMLCGACDNKCPKDIDVKDMFYTLRKDVFKNNKKELKSLGYNAVKFHQINSFSPLFSSKNVKVSNNRGSESVGVSRNVNIEGKSIFLPGCSLASYSPQLIENTFEYLRDNIKDISLAMKCCAKPTEAMGDSEKFRAYYSDLERLFEEDNIKEVIVACPNCLNTIKKHSKNIKVTSIWEIISKYGIPNNLEKHYKNLDTTFTLHDPCPMRNEYKIHDNVRQILSDIGVSIIEFDSNRENSECCGSGGMVRLTSPQISKKQTNKRANDAKADVVITYCQSCCESMMIGNKKTLHLLDLIFNEDVINKNIISQKPTSTINKWSNRYISKKLVKEE